MPATDLSLLIDTAHAAGDVSRRFTGKEAKRWDKPGGAGPVTEADIAVNALMEDRLRSARPDYGWLSEETDDTTARLSADKVFIVDPIDGTRSFVEGSNTWAHAMAVAQGGIITAAVIYLPMRDKLYEAALGQGARLNGAPVTASGIADICDACVLAARPAMEPRHWEGPIPDFRRDYRPSLAYRLGLVAEARFDAMLTLRRSWEWDIAAGALIVSEAGGRISDRKGGDLRFNNADPRLDGVVAAGQTLHGALIGALA